MLCVVTGATGCLGMNLIKRLANEGHDVIALGRNQYLGSIISRSGIRFISLDLMDLASLKKISKDADVVFHCAALSSPWGKYKDFYQANVVATQNVIEATPITARLIHVSSSSIYFDYTEKHNVKENAVLPKKAATHCIRTKLMAETLIDKAYQEQNLNVITIRPRAIFGPYDRSVIPGILKSEKQGVVPLIGTGQNIIDITCVENAVDSLILAAKADSQFCGNKYNISNGAPTTLMAVLISLYKALDRPLKTRFLSYSLAKKIAGCYERLYRFSFIKKEPWLTKYSAGTLFYGQTLNIDAAIHDLKYSPSISIDQGFEHYANWYKNHD
ncbi:NAD(P)-dependent oxidoreductase [uncultured Legionella sp.]|uniref:NAD-dependent epimerase/dehydratase family protein n=1 Tax=uncultured Legionella sp. TaxID=210934 RepID=UPI0026065095|nr:NAD(P)-dependent oxidoreductase [uncultured Legionella sp.]